MLFDLNPKEKSKDLYDRKKELDALSESLRLGERLIVVYGIRRIGKTSLIHVFLNKKESPYVLIDAREIYSKYSSVSANALYEIISSEFISFNERFGFDSEETLMENYRQIFAKSDITALLKGINKWCNDKKLRYVIVFDEAQYLRYGGSVKYDMLIAWSIDNLVNITYILTGSEIGMLKEFLKYDDVKAPLYGRFRNEITLERFETQMSENFLIKGFEELNKRINQDDIKDAVEKIDGIAGWLTYYGYYMAVKGLTHEVALKNVFDEGSKIVINEIDGLVSKSKSRYLSILGAIVVGGNKWSEIKRYSISKNGAISDTRFNALIQSLVKFGLVEKTEDDTYAITDPIALHAIKKLVKTL